MKKLLLILFIGTVAANYIYAESANIDVYFDKNLRISNVKFTGGQMACGAPINYVANPVNLNPDVNNYKSYFMVDGPFVKNNYGSWKCYIAENINGNNIKNHQTYFNLRNAKIEFDVNGQRETCTINQDIGTINDYKYLGMIGKKNKLVAEYTSNGISCGSSDENLYYKVDTSLGSTSYKNGGIIIYSTKSLGEELVDKKKNEVTITKGSGISSLSAQYISTVVDQTCKGGCYKAEYDDYRLYVAFFSYNKAFEAPLNSFIDNVGQGYINSLSSNNVGTETAYFTIKTEFKINGDELTQPMYFVRFNNVISNPWIIGCTGCKRIDNYHLEVFTTSGRSYIFSTKSLDEFIVSDKYII